MFLKAHPGTLGLAASILTRNAPLTQVRTTFGYSGAHTPWANEAVPLVLDPRKEKICALP